MAYIAKEYQIAHRSNNLGHPSYIVTAYMAMGHRVMAYIFIPYIGMAYTVMAYIVIAHIVPHRPSIE